MSKKQPLEGVALDRRPPELVASQNYKTEQNDELIVTVLKKMEDPSTRGSSKATVEMIAELTGLSPNTIRNRPWALIRLKAIKLSIKDEVRRKIEVDEEEKTPSKEDVDLGAMLKNVLAQNALLYEEILSLQATAARQARVIAELTAQKLTIVRR
ncbi:hypothetical protein [Janthinobacterium tructae]|jgi:hypothetical protein|uniref:hypothetical protein n=1 Tax=Janthinobacterium tructae TaxID=2590869 RepID=UPI00249C3C5E|nr:hypothetical protein [Janthinobacterium tructae]MDI3294362.1 hypothetical protein [Janthinobacterium tructae]